MRKMITLQPDEIVENTPKDCVLCGDPAAMGGLFIPDNAKEFGYENKEGRFRASVYGLCQNCKDEGEINFKRIEDLLREH